MTQAWSGRTDEIQVPMLNADFWKQGTEIEGVFESFRELPPMGDKKEAGRAYRLVLTSPVEIDGEAVPVVELPTLSGIKYAIRALKEKGYVAVKGDMWLVSCYEVRKATKEGFSDSPSFKIDVMRKPAAAKA